MFNDWLRAKPILIFGAALIAILIYTACGRDPSGSDWLILTTSDTITVGDAGRLWQDLGDQSRNRFRASDNPIGEFIVALARKSLVNQELERLGYLRAPNAIYRASSWARFRLFSEGLSRMRSEIAAGITSEDIELFADHMGKTVWYTLGGDRQAVSHGPAHLPLLRTELAAALDTMGAGERADLEGGGWVRLDSVASADSQLVAITLQDSARIAELAVDRLTGARFGAMRDSMRAKALLLSEIDYDLLQSISSSWPNLPDSIMPKKVMSCSQESWTVEKLLADIAFENTMRSIDPSDADWLEFFCQSLLLRASVAEYLSELDPRLSSTIVDASSDYLRSQAADRLYSDMVAESVSVTPAEMEEEYHSLEQPPTVPEKRRFLAVAMFSEDEAQLFRNALAAGIADSAAMRLPMLPGLADSTAPPPLTRPLELREVPGGHGQELFGLGRSDTSRWIGPLPVADYQCWVAFKLREVLPAHPASLEEATPQLEAMVRALSEERRFNAWIAELEGRYDLRINDRIIEDLPADPAMWVDL